MQLDIPSGENERFTFLCERYRYSNIQDADDVAHTYRSLVAQHPGFVFLFTLDDLGQACYTSMHAETHHRLDSTRGHDLSGLPDTCFENGEHKGYLTCKEEFFIVKSNFEKACKDTTFDNVCERGISLFNGSIKEFEAANHDILSVFDKSGFVLKVPGTHSYESIYAFPNGYFSSDLDPFENYVFAKLLDERYGYRFIGLGASHIAFLKTRPLNAEEEQDFIATLTRVYRNDFNDELNATLLRMLREQVILVLKYTE